MIRTGQVVDAPSLAALTLYRLEALTEDPDRAAQAHARVALDRLNSRLG